MLSFYMNNLIKLTFLVILTILSVVLDAQVKSWYDYDGLPAPNQPNINSIDTNIIVNRNTFIDNNICVN